MPHNTPPNAFHIVIRMVCYRKSRKNERDVLTPKRLLVTLNRVKPLLSQLRKNPYDKRL